MEPLTKKSNVKVARDTDVVRVADTQMCWQEIHEKYSQQLHVTILRGSTRFRYCLTAVNFTRLVVIWWLILS